MYRVVLKRRAFLRTYHSTFNHALSLGLLGMGLFAATTLGSMTLGSVPAYAVCTSNANGGDPDNVDCLDDDPNGLTYNSADSIYVRVGPNTPALVATTGNNDPVIDIDRNSNTDATLDINSTGTDTFINMFITSADPATQAAVSIQQLGGSHAVELTTDDGDIYFTSDFNSTIETTTTDGDDGLHIEVDDNVTDGDHSAYVVSRSNITTLGSEGDDQAVSIFVDDGMIDFTSYGNLRAPNGNADGVRLLSDDGNINATIHGLIGSSTEAIADMGMDIDTNDGDVSVALSSTSSLFSNSDGINIDQSAEEDDNATIDVELRGGVTVNGDFNNANGVEITAADSAIGINTYPGGTIANLDNEANDHGIQIIATNSGGQAIDLYIGDTITTAGGDGIFIDTTGGEVLVETGGLGDIDVAGHGVNVTSDDNNITENIGENITAGLSAVRVGDGEVVTLNFGDETNTTKIIAGEGSDTNAVVNVLDYDQDSLLTNYSTIRSTAATLVEQADDLAINVTTVDDTDRFDIDNYNTIIGRIDGSDGANTVNNFSDDSWIVAGVNVVNDFGDGEDIINNYGRMVTALSADIEESVFFTNLEQFNNGFETVVGTGPNYGLLTMIDQSAGQAFMRDTTTFSGDGLVWAGGPNSQLGIDAFLGGASDTADLLEIGGDNTGTTAVRVNDINGGAGVYNPDGILFASVEGDSPAGSFFLPNGPIDKGFFTYDVLRNEADTVDWLLASAPNGRAFELPKLVTGAQTIWHETTGVWLDRTADLRRIMACAPAPVAAPVQQLPPLKLGPSGDAYATAAAPCYQQRFGVWGRAFGGDFDRSVRDRTTLTLTGSPATFKGNYNQDLAGAQGGADVVLLRENSGYGALFVGVLGGFVESDMDFKATKDKANFDGGTVGVYGTYVAGPWYADLLFKADLLDLTYKTSFQGSKASADADSFGIRLDTGYRVNTGSGFFFDPQGTLAWVDSDLGNLSLLKTTTSFGDGESLRGRLGLRAGYSLRSGNTIVEPFAVASVWHEFEGDNKASLMSNGFTLVFNDSLDETWGEVGGGLNVFSGGSSAFVKADALVGSDLEGWKVTGGGRLAW